MGRFRGVVVAVALFVAATLVALALRDWADVDNPSSVYLLSVAAIALITGTRLAVVAAVAAFVLYNFLFIEPRFSLAVGDAQSLLTLILLLVIGLVVGRLTSLGRERAAQAARREREARALFAVSRVLVTTPRTQDALLEIARHIARETELDRVWIALGPSPALERTFADSDAGAPPPTSSQPSLLRRDSTNDARWMRIHTAAAAGSRLTRGKLFRVAIAAGEETFGSLYGLRQRGSADPSVETSRLLATAADQIAQALQRDRLERRALDVELAERSDAAKTALLDLVSHELRTPLAAIRASAGSLAERSLRIDTDERYRLAEAIDREAMRLNRLVENLLDMSRLQAGRVAAEIEVIPVHDALEGVIERLKPGLGGRSVEVSVAPDLPPVLADATFLERVVTNLLENAVRYSPADAPVRVMATAEGDSVMLCVEDGGDGVPDDQLGSIFERFFRGRSANARPGTGLGLALVRGLVEAMAGEVSAHRSALGGLAVKVRLPAAEGVG